MAEFTTRDVTKEEGEALTKDLQEVLAKHDAELGISSTIQLLKRVPKEMLSPFMQPNGDSKTEENTDSKTA